MVKLCDVLVKFSIQLKFVNPATNLKIYGKHVLFLNNTFANQ